jgi:hypothetical protein
VTIWAPRFPRLPFFLLDGYRVSTIALHGPLRPFAHTGVVPFAGFADWPSHRVAMAPMTAISTPKAQTDDVPGLIEMAAGDSSPSVLADVLHAGPKLSAVARQRAWDFNAVHRNKESLNSSCQGNGRLSWSASAEFWWGGRSH